MSLGEHRNLKALWLTFLSFLYSTVLRLVKSQNPFWFQAATYFYNICRPIFLYVKCLHRTIKLPETSSYI